MTDQKMMIYNDFLFKKADKVICPSCRKNVFIKEDVPISKAEKLVKCGRCGAYVRYGKLQKVNGREVKE